MRRALITGITGQDGSYLAEFLLGKPDYEVHGLVRRSSSLNRQRIDHILGGDSPSPRRFHLHYADLADASSLSMLMEQVRPDEVYNLGAQSHVRVSFDQPLYTADVVGLGTLRLLEAVRQLEPRASRCGSTRRPAPRCSARRRRRRGSDTPFHPRSPYACAKLYAHWQTINYREAYGLFACSGILFNHESPRRGESFVTRKVTLGATADQGRASEEAGHGQPRRQARLGLRRRLRRGHVADAPAGASPTTTSSPPARPTRSASCSNSPSRCSTSTITTSSSSTPGTRGPRRSTSCWATPTKAREVLGWKPEVDFHGLVKMMIEHDLELARREKYAGTYQPV